MTRTKWPAWHKEHELTAEDLRGLEDYVLSRSQILDEDVFGVDRIVDWKASIQFAWDNSANGRGTLSISGVRGVTAGGHPVWLRDGDEPLVGVVGSTETPFQPGDLIDIWIDVNSRNPGAEKLTVDGTLPPKEPAEQAALESLFLGRYKLPYPGGISGLELKLRPFCRRLSAFGPVDDEWNEWVKPLSIKLQKLLAGAARNSVFGAEVARLMYEWPVLPITVLARRLRMIAWMHGREQGATFPVDLAAVVAPLPTGELQGYRLPEDLAALLPEGPSRASGFARSLHAVLDVLAQTPVKFHAPIGCLKQWREELATAATTGISKLEQEDVSRAIASAQQRDDWSKAVALITAMILEPGNRKLAADCAEHMKQLYAANSAKGPSAGPMAFYCLAEAAKSQPQFPSIADPALRRYFDRLRGKQIAGTDRLLRYLDREMRSDRPQSQVKPYAWWGKHPHQAQGAPSGELRVVVAGSPGSGKSTLIARLFGPGEDPAGARGAAAGEFYGRVTSATGGLQTAVAEIDIGTDGSGTDPASAREALTLANLLILTIAPRETYEWNLDALRDLAVWTLRQQPNTTIAIVYTKADEYGVVEAATVRLIGEAHKDQVRAMQSAGNPDREFRSFAEGTREVTVEERIDDGLRIFPQKTAGTRSTACRRHVLMGTQPLWTTVLPRLLNGYFVAAAPCEAYLNTTARCGLAHLASDVVEYFRG